MKKIRITKSGYGDINRKAFLFFIIIITTSVFFASCDKQANKKKLESDIVCDQEQIIQPIDGSKLELTFYEYLDWLKSNKGITYNVFENDTILVSILYQPIPLQAAMGIRTTGMTYDELLNSKKGYHYFSVDCLYKKMSVMENNNRVEFLNSIKKHLHIIRDKDTVQNVLIESFASSIINKPDNLMILVPEEGGEEDLICSINDDLSNEVKIRISKKQFALFPKLKL